MHGLTCERCQAHTSALSKDGICDSCLVYPSPINTMRHLWNYEGNVRGAICAMKYRPSEKLLRLIGREMAENVDTLFDKKEWDLVIAMPSSRTALIKRGLSQCTILAREVAKELNLPCPKFLLKHRGSKHSQASLGYKKRLSNIKNAFYAKSNTIAGKRILLIDDVITTGATTSAAANALRHAGAISIDVYAVARAQIWNSFRGHIAKKFGYLHPRFGSEVDCRLKSHKGS